MAKRKRASEISGAKLSFAGVSMTFLRDLSPAASSALAAFVTSKGGSTVEPEWVLGRLLDESLAAAPISPHIIITGKGATLAAVASSIGPTEEDVLAGSIRQGWVKVLTHEWLQACKQAEQLVDDAKFNWGAALVSSSSTSSSSSASSSVAASRVVEEASVAQPPAAKRQATIGSFFGSKGSPPPAAAAAGAPPLSSSSSSSSSGAASATAAAAAPSSGGGVPASPAVLGSSRSFSSSSALSSDTSSSSYPHAKAWSSFPTYGPCGNGLGLLPTPLPFLPRPERGIVSASTSSAGGRRVDASSSASSSSSLPTVPPFILDPATWYGTQTDPVLRATPFVALAGRTVAVDPVAMVDGSGQWALSTAPPPRVLSSSSSSSSSSQPSPFFPPGNAVSLAGTLHQRLHGFLSMTPATLGECSFAHFPGAASSGATGGSSSGSSGDPSPCPVVRVAAFDLDGTLIKPSSPGAKFCGSATDWVPAFPGAFNRLRDMAIKGGYEVVVFTNQAGVAKGKTTLPVVQARCAAVAAALGVPVTVLVAPGDSDFYRKPRTGMWWLWEAVVWPALQRHRQRAGGAGTAAGTRSTSSGGSCSSASGGVITIDDDEDDEDTVSAPAPHPPLALISHSDSVYVGDAAGRPPGPGRSRKDHSAGDIQFALACGLRFATPEALFLGSNVPPDRSPLTQPGALGAWVAGKEVARPPTVVEVAGTAVVVKGDGDEEEDPEVTVVESHGSSAAAPYAAAGRGASTSSSSSSSSSALASSAGVPVGQEVVLLVGLPGCGKSTYAAHNFPRVEAPSSGASSSASSGGSSGYVRVNQDVLGTRDRAKTAARAALGAGASVVVDATNVDPATRGDWAALAKAHGQGVPLRVLFFDVPRALAFHLNEVRSCCPLGGIDGPSDRRRVPTMAINVLLKNLVPPQRSSEPGLTGGVTKVAFTPGPFAVNRMALREVTGRLRPSSDTGQEGRGASTTTAGGGDGAGDSAVAQLMGLAAAQLGALARACSEGGAGTPSFSSLLPEPLPASYAQVFAEALALQCVYGCMGT